jgi:hypothetical protein
MYIKRSHKDFLNHFKNKQPELFSRLEILNEFKNSQTKLLVKDKYGICLVSPGHLIEGKYPTIVSSINKTEYFKNKILEINPEFFNNNEFLSEYINNSTPIVIKSKDFTTKRTPASLLTKPNIITEIFKEDHLGFIQKVKRLNPDFFTNFSIIDKYKTAKKSILINSKFGILKVKPSLLYTIKIPTMHVAVNKTEYFIKASQVLHKNTYDYSISKYISGEIQIKIICKKHGIFEQLPNNHIKGHGCQLCANINNSNFKKENCSGFKSEKWILNAYKSKHFDSFKIYIIKCWNTQEVFYKIGRTFKKVEKRFNDKKTMPYNYEILKIIEDTGKNVCKLEKTLHKILKKYKYEPLIKFDGMHECFFKIKN